MTLALNGIGVGKGVGIGKAHILRRGYADISHYNVPARFVADEVGRYRAALAAVRQQLESARLQIPRDVPVDILALIDVHLLMTQDSAFAREPVLLIERHRCNAEWALQMQREALVQAFGAMSDPYLRARVDDVEHVADHILRELARAEQPSQGGESLRGRVLLVQDLAPADAVLLQQHGVRALITESGGVTSHTAILARSLGVPTIIGLRQALRYIRQGDVIVVDGERGTVIVDPDERTLGHYQRRQQQTRRARAALARLSDRPAVSRDGVKVALRANVELPEEMLAAKRAGAEGVGLYRTEFLFMDRSELPCEEEQFEAYVHLVQAMDGAPVTIRTVDLGADKTRDGHGDGVRVNPALGLRGIRWCLHEPTLLRPQLRAILRASAFGPVRLCIPMLTGMRELREVLNWIARAKTELDVAGVEYDPDLPVGAMIEVPAAALMAEAFAAELDFLSIGTNDLIQYTLAADRLDEDVNYLYDALHPAVLRLIDMALRAGAEAGVPVAMCGEMAGESRYTRLLLGLGLRDFSMHPGMVLEVKRAVHHSDVAGAARYARAALRAVDAPEVAELVEQLNRSA